MSLQTRTSCTSTAVHFQRQCHATGRNDELMVPHDIKQTLFVHGRGHLQHLLPRLMCRCIDRDGQQSHLHNVAQRYHHLSLPLSYNRQHC